MYIREIEIISVRSIPYLRWALPRSQRSPGWHVIVGDNGSGKTSFLRAIALALVGPRQAVGLRLSWEDWLTKDHELGSICLTIDWNPSIDRFSRNGKPPEVSSLEFGVEFARGPDEYKHLTALNELLFPSDESRYGDAERHAWGEGGGWFCAAYGPFRRLTGGDIEFERLSLKLPRLARFLSIFDERVALTDCLEWLQALRFEQLEKTQHSKKPKPEDDFLSKLLDFINQPDFLPFHARLTEISSKKILFVDGNDNEVRIEDLSDGYRSILSMTFELVRQLANAYGTVAIFDPEDPGKIVSEGVVLIDEIDVHLHPTWQRRIGLWFREHFPNIQFIVSTHSPLICQAADVGTVFRLPRPGFDEPGGMVEGTQLQRLLYGNVLDAYGTEVFGPGVTRSDQSKVLSKRLAELNVKEVREGLNQDEKRERDRLREAMPTEALSAGSEP